MREWDVARWLRRRVADDPRSHSRRRPDQPLRDIRRGGPRRRARAASTNCSRRRHDWKTRQAMWLNDFRHTSRPATGTAMAEMLAEDMCHRRSSSGGECRGPARSRRRNREHAGHRRPRCHEHERRPSLRPAGSASPSVVFACRAATSGPRRSTPRCSAWSRSTPTTGSRRVSCSTLDDIDAAFEELDARYLAGEAAAHAHTWSVIAGAYAAFNRHESPATAPDWVSIDHRPIASNLGR